MGSMGGKKEIGREKIPNLRRDRCFTASSAPPPTQTWLKDDVKREGRSNGW